MCTQSLPKLFPITRGQVLDTWGIIAVKKQELLLHIYQSFLDTFKFLQIAEGVTV